MINNFPGEQWKTVHFTYEYNYNIRLDISNYGRLKTFNKLPEGNIIAGSMINGYRIIRLKLLKPREEKAQQQFDYFQLQITSLKKQLKLLTAAGENEARINDITLLLTNIKNNFAKTNNKDLKARTTNYQSLIHRLVADCFLQKPGTGQLVVAHLDHDKLNNRVSNLKWMTLAENYEHQKRSPHVIRDKQEKKEAGKESSKSVKLTAIRVMYLKKLLNQGKSVKQLARTFKVTDTQIIRIKRGENWAEIKAAE